MFDELIWFILKVIGWGILIYIVISYLINPGHTFGIITSRWHKPFDFQFSTKEFYASVRAAIKAQEVSDIAIHEVEHSQEGLLSSRRWYLQVRRGDQLILICAAPFGKGFFVSWWNGEKLNFIKDLIPRIPNIGPALAKYMYKKTFYQLDTENAFKEMVRQAVLDVIDKMTNDKGVRGLTELERRAIDVPLTNRMQ